MSSNLVTGILLTAITLLPAILSIAFLVGLWKCFVKAGLSGFEAIIPIYNVYLVVKMSEMSPLVLIGLLIPVLNLITTFVIYYNFAENFGANKLYRVMTGLLPFLMVPVLGFGSFDYQGPEV